MVHVVITAILYTALYIFVRGLPFAVTGGFRCVFKANVEVFFRSELVICLFCCLCIKKIRIQMLCYFAKY